MDNLSKNYVEAALKDYQLIRCNSQIIHELEPKRGGILEISTEMKTPLELTVLNKGEGFAINIVIEVLGKPEDSTEIAFSASCEFKGDYIIADCDKGGIQVKDNIKFWSLIASQLHPLASQFVSDLLLKMGIKNISMPLMPPGQYSQKKISKKTRPKKDKTTNI